MSPHYVGLAGKTEETWWTIVDRVIGLRPTNTCLVERPRLLQNEKTYFCRVTFHGIKISTHQVADWQLDEPTDTIPFYRIVAGE